MIDYKKFKKNFFKNKQILQKIKQKITSKKIFKNSKSPFKIDLKIMQKNKLDLIENETYIESDSTLKYCAKYTSAHSSY
jgi:hypothetical protein